MKKFILIVFSSSTLGHLEDVSKIKHFLLDNATKYSKGASTGSITLTFFASTKTKAELRAVLADIGLQYILFNAEDAEMSLPPIIQNVMSKEFPFFREDEGIKKMSLQQQLEAALEVEDFALAAKIRDKINSKNNINQI